VKKKSCWQEKGPKKERKETNLVITINKLLLAKTDEFPCGQKVSTFKSPRGAEAPTRTARTLINSPTKSIQNKHFILNTDKYYYYYYYN